MAYFSKWGIDESSNLCIKSSNAEWGTITCNPLTCNPLTNEETITKVRLDDIGFKNHKTEILVSPADYELLKSKCPSIADSIRDKREIAVIKEVLNAKGNTFEEKADNVLNDWKYNEEIIKSNAKYKIRHHHRII